MMIATPYRRFKSGSVCIEAGRYEFDGYLDGSSALLPALEEMEVTMSAGQMFPMIRDHRKPCFWSRSEETIGVEDEEATLAYTVGL